MHILAKSKRKLDVTRNFCLISPSLFEREVEEDEEEREMAMTMTMRKQREKSLGMALLVMLVAFELASTCHCEHNNRCSSVS